MARLRAVEHARTVVQVATSGKSAIIDPSGRTMAESGPLFTADTLLATVPLSGQTTLATRTGAAAEWLLAVLGVLGMLVGGRGGWRRRRPATAAEPAATAEPAGTAGPAGPAATAEPEQAGESEPVTEPVELTGKGHG